MNIKYCSDFINQDTFCHGKCGDPHIKFELLRVIYKEEAQIMYKSCAICSSNRSSVPSVSPRAPSEESSHSLKSTNPSLGRRSPLPYLPHRRIVPYDSETDENYDSGSAITESGSQRSISPHSSSSKDGNSVSRRTIARNAIMPCRFYQKGGCKKGNSCIFSHFGGPQNKK